MQSRTKSSQARLILASSSRYRKTQLQQLVKQFECIAPRVDESPLAGESAAALAERVALAKASKVAKLHPEAIVLGSDQVAVLGSRFLGKPGSIEGARKQLAQCSGKSVVFETAVALVQCDNGLQMLARVTTRVEFRELDSDEIFRYVERDNPVDCAGSFKIESAGSALFTRIVCEDPTALMGLPLIETAAMLRHAGIPLP